MKKKFDELYESFNVYKAVKREFYPRQIKFSPEFLEAVETEYNRQRVDENTGTSINNCRNKFLKALNFHLRQVDEGTINEETQEQVVAKQRKFRTVTLKKRPTEVKRVLKTNINHAE